MMRSANDLLQLNTAASDGEVGTVNDFYFDDANWVLRYLVLDTGKLLPGRRVLIAPVAIRDINWDGGPMTLSLTRNQIESSPGIEADKPVSRQMEGKLVDYYGWPAYWGAQAVAGPPAVPPSYSTAADRGPGEDQADLDRDPHLRSMREVIHYQIAATDGDLGHVEDFLLDDETWQIRFMVVDTRNWWPGKKVVVAPVLIRSVEWSASRVVVDATREVIKNGPEYTPSTAIDRGYDKRYHDYYIASRKRP